MKRLRKIIFWSHLLAGVLGGIVIFIMSATGVLLMYERQLVEYAERGVLEVVQPGAKAQRLSLDELVAKARGENRGAQPTAVVLRNDSTASVAVGFGREGTTYVDPYTGAILGKESKLHDRFHDIIDWHRWLGMEGEGRATGRAITGACNLAFFWLAVTGVYLWWPRSWHWRGLKPCLVFNSRLRGKARDWNWHNVIGFWSSGVLVMLTLTASVMSYRWANDLLYTLAGSEPPPRAQGPVAQPQQPGAGAKPSEHKPLASFDAFLMRAEEQAPGWVMMTVRLPPHADGPVTVLIQEPTAPHVFARSQLALHRSNAEVVRWDPYAKNSLGRKLRMWVRGLHTGEALGLAGQTVAGLASLGGCFLVWTGWAMAWRRFRYRKREADEQSPEKSVNPGFGGKLAVSSSGTGIRETLLEASSSGMEDSDHPGAGVPSHNGFKEERNDRNCLSDNSHSVLILYGTVTGNAELLAHRLAGKLRSGGLIPRVRDMADCQAGMLKQASCVLMVVSTYGDGEPPDDAAPFWEEVVRGHGVDLRGLRFSVLALGDATFDRFCGCGRDFDAALERQGATRLYPRVDCDVDYDEQAQQWFDGVLAKLRQHGYATPSASI